MNKDWKKCFYSNSSIPAAATFFPMSAIVKPSLEDRDDRKAGMPDYQSVETIAAILTWECECYNERDFNLYSTVLWNANSLFIVDAVNKDYTYINDF